MPGTAREPMCNGMSATTQAGASHDGTVAPQVLHFDRVQPDREESERDRLPYHAEHGFRKHRLRREGFIDDFHRWGYSGP